MKVFATIALLGAFTQAIKLSQEPAGGCDRDAAISALHDAWYAIYDNTKTKEDDLKEVLFRLDATAEYGFKSREWADGAMYWTKIIWPERETRTQV